MGNFGCGDGGWTLAMKINGSKVQISLQRCQMSTVSIIDISSSLTVANVFFLPMFNFRELSITILTFGATEIVIILQQVRLGLTHKRPSYQPTGTRPSLRFVLVWRSAKRLTSLSSTRQLTLCTHWSLTGNTVPPRWAVTPGRHWLAHRPHYSSTVTLKGSMLWVLLIPKRKQESASSITSKMDVRAVIPESGLAQEGTMMTTTRVGTKQLTGQITESNISKPWVTSWCSDMNCVKKLLTSQGI